MHLNLGVEVLEHQGARACRHRGGKRQQKDCYDAAKT
jgi:hypothetical protein